MNRKGKESRDLESFGGDMRWTGSYAGNSHRVPTLYEKETKKDWHKKGTTRTSCRRARGVDHDDNFSASLPPPIRSATSPPQQNQDNSIQNSACYDAVERAPVGREEARIGAVPVPGLNEPSADVDLIDPRTTADTTRASGMPIPEAPQTVVAQAITSEDLAHEMREELRAEIRQEMQAIQGRVVTAEAVHVTVASGSFGEEPTNVDRPPTLKEQDKIPFWRSKWFIIVAIVLLIAAIAGVVGAILGGSSNGSGGGSLGKESLTGSPTTDSPTQSPVTDQPVTPSPTQATAKPDTDSPTTTTQPSETTPPETSSPTPPSTTPPTQPPTTPPVTASPTPPPTPPSTIPSTLPVTSSPTPPSTNSPTQTFTVSTPPPTTPPVTASPTPPPTIPSTLPIPNVNALQTLRGLDDDSRFGVCVEFSGDGRVMAAGAINKNTVIVYRRSGNDWKRYGQVLKGSGSFGGRVGLSDDGRILVVGARSHDDGGDSAGQVRVFRMNSEEKWDSYGSRINGRDDDDEFAWDVAVSDSGRTIAASSYLGNPSGRMNAGYVRVFTWSGNWIQLGSDIQGENALDMLGRAIAFDSTGRRIAVGIVNGGSGAGRVKVYDYVDGSWRTVGQDLDGVSFEDSQGTSVALSSDGSVLAIGADGNDETGAQSGMVRVYKLSGSTWIQRGQNIYGQGSPGHFGYGHLGLSDDGNLLLAGAPNIDEYRGEAYLFQYNAVASKWEQVAEVRGDSPGGTFGQSVALSGDGSYFAVGAPDDGNGYVRVFSVD